MDKKNVVYIISFLNKSQVFEWTVELLDRQKFNYYFILLHYEDSPFEEFLRSLRFDVYRVPYRGRKNSLKAIRAIYRRLKAKKADVVHAHLFDAGLVGLTAARLAGIKCRIYTRHYSTLNHLYYKHAVWYDKYINSIATRIIAVSGIVRDVLIKMEGVPAEKISVIHHGFKPEDFDSVKIERVDAIKSKYKINSTASPIIGVISRYIHLKGIQYIIPAFKKFRTTYPNALLVLANTDGTYKSEIKQMLNELPPGSYVEIPFENDIAALYKVFNIFIHVPIDSTSEAFGQVYIEPLLAKVPAIFTLSGIANDFIVDKQNAIVVPYESEESIYNGLVELMENSELKSKIIENGYESACKLFPVKVMVEVEKLYE